MWNRNLVLGEPRKLIKNLIFERIEYTWDVEIAERFNGYLINNNNH